MHLSAHLDLDVLAHETDDTVSVLIELAAPTANHAKEVRAPSTLEVVLDRSASMQEGRLEGAKTALLGLVDRLDPSDHFGLVAFDDAVSIIVPCGPLTDKPAVKQAIAAVHVGGCTDLSGGYLRGLQEATRARTAAGATVLLISDGHANAGIVDPDPLGRLAAKAHADGITTSTLGFGLGYDERLMSAIARGGTGNELFAEEPDTAVKLIAGEVDGLLSLVAQAGSLLVRMSPYVRAVAVVNELSSAMTGDGLVTELGSFYAEEKRRIVLTLDVPGIPALGLAEIASLELSYVSLPALERQAVTVPICVNVVPGDEAAGRVPNPTVRTELAYQQAQVAKRHASEALSRGDVEAALADLELADGVIAGAGACSPPELAAELADEAAALDQLRREASAGNLARAAKLSSYDASLKSRTRGRRPRS